jgi:hypothetical protein
MPHQLSSSACQQPRLAAFSESLPHRYSRFPDRTPRFKADVADNDNGAQEWVQHHAPRAGVLGLHAEKKKDASAAPDATPLRCMPAGASRLP